MSNEKRNEVFTNEQLGTSVRTISYEDGSIGINAEDTAIGFGWYQTQNKNGKQYISIRWETINKYCKEFGFPNKLGKDDYIPESLFYMLGMKAKNEAALKFQKWLATDVIPTIRKHGAYLTDTKIEEILSNPDTIIKLATDLKKEREKRKVLEATNNKQQQIIGELKPKADYTDLILRNKGLVTITQIAKDYGMSGKAMNKKLHELGIQFKQSGQWLLYSDYQSKGYTHSETIDIVKADGTPDIKMNTKWTQKGRLMIYKKLKSIGVLPIIELEEVC
ncbi:MULTISPECIES: phage antirepressor KilAC domain-containing protein [unclassified Clostridioides]|uniref:phage antirepressor KilAC domain-containing protein n=1 Tax=unclassified Clostridioides TaxID=2635829 RepID=UPI001D10394F|nr:phage antirepressor KilAC domain-containing protein [Clostridioides sp. ES-S-0049-03]MCC0678452.1 phage antirepressor KilAC domain-containing protein [Clostridioides sp. ES-W-0018-02]MCC0713364.1 phage antirepressor KilAC domain-containing protein [Clostridioides sp. ES-W-0017-02]